MDASLTSSLGRGLILPDKSSYMDSEVECKPNEDVISCTFRFLDEGEKKIKLDVNHKDSIMLLGNTGSGKTTFAQFIAGDNTKLISKETEEGSGEYIIIGDGISNSTFRSETVFPKLVIDSKRNAAFYDCPGFSDTEGTSNEIAETYFIKKVLDFLESLKMVFVINYSSVKRGNDRQDFMKFLRHATDLVKDIEKYKNSFVMVSTKIENTYIRKEGDLVLVDDDKVIASIAGFLKETKKYLEDNSKISNLSEKKKRFYENALKLVEILLEKEGENYPKIGIFRAPDRPGPVSDIPLLQTAKQYIEKIVHEKLAFSAKNNGDFGYTLSDRTKIDISEIVKEINKKLAAKLSIISEKNQDYCKTLVEQISRKIELIASSVNFVDADPSEGEKLRYKFISAYNSTSELISKMANLTNSEELSGLVKTATSILKIDIPKSDFLYLETQGKYFNFLQTVSDRPLSSKHWNLLFKDVRVFLSGSKTIILKDVEDAAKTIRDKIKNELNDTINVIKDEYTKKLKILEIKKMPETLNRDYKFILQLVSKLKNKTTEELVKAIDYVTENLKINVPKENSQNIKNQGKYLVFLGKLSNMPLKILSTAWLDPFLDLGQYFHESEKWYSFLEDLYNKFSEYAIQKDRQMYNVENLEDWGHPGKSQGIYVTPKTFSKFLDKIRNLNVAEYETVEKLSKISDLQVEELNEALSLTLRHRPTVRCSGPHITVEGTFIVLEDIMNSLKTNLDTNNGCNNFESMLKADKYDLFKVFSLNRVFIDTNLSFSGNRISVAVIAPKWEVVGSRSIDLSGSEGAPPKEPKAKNSTRQRENGTNGVPGNPGVTGETFFGIGTSFVGGTNLKIISYGGRGGPGQDGGDGGPGAPGRDGLKPVEGDHQLCNSNENYRGFKCELVSHVWKGWSAYYINTYKVHGEPGGRGARGGDGGKGGKGGHTGNIRIIELSQPSEIRNITTVENEGKNGSGGSGGEGGKHGDDIIAALRVSPPMGRFQPHYNYKWTEINTEQNNSKGPSGERGKDGANIAGQKDAVPAKGVGSVPTMINEYKIYLRENMNSRFTKSSLLRFLDELDKSDKVNNAYDILAFIEEFKGIEKQYPNLKNQMDFSVFYNSLLDRIGEFAKHLKKGEPLKENKKVLNYLYTATLARLRNLRERSETGLIIDIRKYMNLIQDNIKTLKDLETQSNKVEVVNRYKESYKKGIDKKIQEATSFIENTVSPEIDKINANIDDQVDTLIEEVIELQKEAKEEIQKLEEKKKELEKTLALKGFFGCLQLIGGVVKFLGPMGKIAGAVMDAANSVGDALILDDQETPIELPKDIASSIDTIAGKIKKMRNKKADILQKSLDNLSEEIEKNPDKLGDMKDKINDIKEKLKKSTENKLDYEQVKMLTNDLNKELERKGIDLKSNPKDKKSKSALEVIEKIEKVGEYGSLLLDVYDKYKKEEGKIKEVDDSIKDLQDKLKDLREYEDSIYETTVPMLNEMLKHMKDINEKMGTKSQVALDVTKWQVQSNLKDMRREMQKLTKGFSVQDDISRSIEKLEEVMTTLITIYDRIQSYQDQEKLAVISEISAPLLRAESTSRTKSW